VCAVSPCRRRWGRRTLSWSTSAACPRRRITHSRPASPTSRGSWPAQRPAPPPSAWVCVQTAHSLMSCLVGLADDAGPAEGDGGEGRAPRRTLRGPRHRSTVRQQTLWFNTYSTIHV
jgi:hypothetical protein